MRATPPTDRFAFDRSDRVGLRILVWGAALVALATQVAAPAGAWLRGRPLEVDLASTVRVPQLDAARVGYGPASYSVTLAHPGPLDYALMLTPGLLLVALLAVGALLVQRVLRAVAAGDPFAPKQVGRLRRLAVLLAFGSVAHAFLELSCTGAILGRMNLGGLAPVVVFSMPWLPVVLGLVVAMLAEAFTVGSRLRDDVDGLV